jgi:outer membrane protein TolC
MSISKTMPAFKKTPYTVPCSKRIVVFAFVVFLVLTYGQISSVLLAQDTMSRQQLLFPYEQRMASVDEQHSIRMAKTQQEIPPGFQPWWSPYQERPLWQSSRALAIDIETLVLGTMKYSPKVLALSTIPEIRKTDITEAQALFDARSFLESKFIRTSDPVTNFLMVGGGPRYRDQNWYASGGVRRRSLMGGNFEVSQRLGFEDNNSIYYKDTNIPVPQGSSKLAISYTQPLLNGAGRAYNESVIVLAMIDAGVACDQFAAELQNHLLDVNKAYWTLYMERVTLLQKRRLAKEAEAILNELEARKTLDANTGQIIRARAAVESRRAGLVRYEAAVYNAEARIQLLVNDPHLLAPERAELIPIQYPQLQYPSFGVRDSLITALHNRPEVNQSLQEIRAACLREKIATKDLLPVLDAVLSMYVSGLATAGSVGDAFTDQFSVGEPGYTTGLMFEMPLGNRAAKARLCKRQLEIQQFSFQLKQTVAVVVEEIEVAVRDVDAAYNEAQARYLSMKAADTEIKYLESRWRLLPSEDQVAGIVLEDLLAAQERAGNAEIGYASAQVSFNMALAHLNRATGILLQCLSDPGSGERGMPPSDNKEDIPVPPSEVLAPLPPTVSNAPATVPIANAPNNNPAQSQVNLQRTAGLVEKSQVAPMLAEKITPPANGVKPLPMPKAGAIAPLPPPVVNVPTTAAGTSAMGTGAIR